MSNRIEKIEKSDVIRFINWYPENTQPEANTHRALTNMTIGLWDDSDHPLAQLGREFKEKCIAYLKANGDT